MSEFANFYALMPPDNSATVASGSNIEFPQTGPTSGGIVRVNNAIFALPSSGVYSVAFQVSIVEPAQLVLTLDNVPLPSTVVGRATGTTQVVGMTLITTTVAGQQLSLLNLSDNAVTIATSAGGFMPVSANLVIQRVQ